MSPSLPSSSSKLYFRIGEVASLVGVEPHVLRYWEREFRSIRPTKSAKGQRVYSRRDVENLMRVRQLLYAEGFTIAGAKKKLQKNGTEPESAVEIARDVQPEARVDARADVRADARVDARVDVRADARVDVKSANGGVHAEAGGRMRATLSELRTEIQAFLVELGG
jgi:DNA-binding transcriptional MerR regulator